VDIFPQSGSNEENVGFVEPKDEQQIEVFPERNDVARSLPGAADASLGNFLGRPLKVYYTQWTAGAPVSFDINPVALFLNSPRVANRITTFKLMRASFKVKVVCNGNSFYMGRLLVAWNPMSAMDDYFVYNGATDLETFAYSVRLSQRQHIMVDPSQSTGGELTLPFIWPKDFFDIPKITSDSVVFGSLSCTTIVPLSQVTEPVPGTVNPVGITVYAWAEDVELGGLTVEDLTSLSPQSGSDEYSGRVSSLASTVATAAHAFITAPYIGPYAMATSIAAGAIASVAKIFGFSKPNLLEEAVAMRPTAIRSLATCVGQDGAVKLTIDPKQEVTIDPRIMGLGGTDEMDIVNIASIPSLIGKFEWNYTHTYGDLLYASLVDPGICHQISNSDTRLFLPACSGVSLPFTYWSGSMEFTFEIVATAYHRGRLAFVYDPQRSPTTYETNISYNYVVDISECRKFKIRIGPSQTSAIMTRFQPLTSGEFMSIYFRGGHGTVGVTPTQILNAGGVGNGVLSVFTVNDLTAPSTTTTGVQILMYVNACEDFRVYAPNSDLYKYNYIVPQSGIEPISDITTNMECPPETVVVRSSDPGLSQIYIGENILSIRTILKRYVHYMAHQVVPSLFSTNLVTFNHAIYPLMYLYARDTIHLNASANGINYVSHSYISYYRAAYTALRGGTRWKVVPTRPPEESAGGYISASLEKGAVTNLPSEYVILTGVNTTPRSFLLANRSTHQGETLTVCDINPTLEFEVPFYSKSRFAVGSSSDETLNATQAPGYRILSNYSGIGSTCSLYVAAAEDLAMFNFHGFPAMTCNQSLIPLAE
jgi:hypothetical protein